MDLHQLKSFAAVAAVGHITRAAERLHLSQPTVSGHIRALEEELGVTLFERTASGVTLTYSGRLLLDDAQSVLDASQYLRDHARALSGSLDARLRIGTILDPNYLRIGALVSTMRERYPLIQVELRVAISGIGLQKVKSGELDAAFVLGEPDDPEVQIMPLEPLHYFIVMPKAWVDRVRTLEELAQQPWVLSPPQGTTNKMAHQFLRERKLAPASVVESDQEQTTRSLVAAGVGAALMREEFARDAMETTQLYIWPDASLHTKLSLVYLLERRHSPEIMVLLRAVEDVWHKNVAAGPRKPVTPKGAEA
jgi:DNA-binding transcriptional LysR family regulator